MKPGEPTRRRFIRKAAVAGPWVGMVARADAESAPDRPAHTEIHSLDGIWRFRFDPGRKAAEEGPVAGAPSAGWVNVTVPHTWNVNPDFADYHGLTWYTREIEVPETWRGQWVRLEFEAVYHTAQVWLNGKLVGKHERKGYTAFQLDISPLLRFGERNVLLVKVDNSFREEMLPRGRSYDWAADGGITRPVNLYVTPPVFLEYARVDAEPDLGRGEAEVRVKVLARNTGKATVPVRVDCEVVEAETGLRIAGWRSNTEVTLEAGEKKEIALPAARFSKPKLWDFDHPNLYLLKTTLLAGDRPVHAEETVFGIRKIEVNGDGFLLNGQRVWLMGVERMAGSNPEYGMAEPGSWIEHDHRDLKELNCVFTRVHWQQDRRVLDYCDRHGILIQEEVPSWGGATFRDLTPETEAAIQENGLCQLREMIGRDGNHPCIFSWGLCNEVNGQNPPARRFLRRMYAEAKKLDPSRPLTYASNSLQKTPEKDAAGEMDFLMWNEYYESWMGKDVAAMEENLKAIHAAFPSKPLVISEYGYCECRPSHTGGDPKRVDILREHTEVFRKYGWVAGAIFFDYNDYRTHIGDKGMGPLKQRVHGVVDLFGERKPSFAFLRREASPVEQLELDSNHGRLAVRVRTRRRLPGYSLRGYSLRWIVYGFGGLPMEAGETALPEMAPGSEEELILRWTEKEIRKIRVDVMRPTGFSAAEAVLKL